MAPKTVVARIWAPTLAGMYLTLSWSISSVRRDGLGAALDRGDPADLHAAHLTLAPVSITRPERSDVNVTGTTDFNVPTNNAYVSQIKTAKITSRISVHQAGCRPPSFVVHRFNPPG